MPPKQTAKEKLKKTIKTFSWPPYVERAVLEGIKEAAAELPKGRSKYFTVKHSIKPTKNGVSVKFKVRRGKAN